MKSKQSGFTLIELMIVIAIIAILMAYAIPAYNDYTVRAKVGEGLFLSSGMKSLVSEAWVAAEDITLLNSGSKGVPLAASITGNNVKSVGVASGAITVTFSAQEAAISGKTLTLTPLPPGVGGNSGASLIWDCTAGIENRYLPTNCRNP